MKNIILGLILASVGMSQVIVTPTHNDPDIIVTTGGIFDFYQHQGASLSAVSYKATNLAGRPTYITDSIQFTLAKGANGALSATGFTTKAGITQVVLHKRILGFWLNSELGITKFDFATLGTFDGAAGLSIDIGSHVTKGKAHVYLIPFAEEVSIAGKQVKPVFGLQIGTGFSKVVN